MNQKQLERLANARDPRFRRIAEKMGYQTRAMKADDEPTELERLRAEYTRVMGKKPYHGWDEDTLRYKMAGAK